MSEIKKDIPYRFCEFWVPKRYPYTGENGWTSIVGNFIKPIVSDEDDMIYWFLQEGRWFQLCYWSPDPHRIERKVRTLCKKKHFVAKRICRWDLKTALAGSRWNIKRKQGTKEEMARSLSLVKACHSICALYLHYLVKRNGFWTTEINKDKQNPHGNIFESFMHLVANLSEAKFDVQVHVRTPWMKEVETYKDENRHISRRLKATFDKHNFTCHL